MSYTKGPYERHFWQVHDKEGNILADCDVSLDNNQLDARTVIDNANLFASSWDMLEALEAIEVEYREMMGVSLTENYSHKRDKRHKEQYRKVFEAIAKAKGGQA